MDRIFHFGQSLGPLEIVGVLGFFLYISAFFAVQWKLMNGNSMVYSLANVTSSVLVSISLIAEFSLSAALIQGSVIAIGGTDRSQGNGSPETRSNRLFLQESQPAFYHLTWPSYCPCRFPRS